MSTKKKIIIIFIGLTCICLLCLCIAYLFTYGYTPTSINNSNNAIQAPTEIIIPIIPFQVIDQWEIPNGGYGKVIIIDHSNVNDYDMRLLGLQVMQGAINDKNAFYSIYDDIKAAQMRQYLADDKYSNEELAFYDLHFVGVYDKNGNTGYHLYSFWLSGINGPQVDINF